MEISTEFLNSLKRMKALADTGLLYAQNDYDKERYEEMLDLCWQMLQKLTGQPLEKIIESFPVAKDYPTAKVDIRGMILSENDELLLVREGVDGRWSLPGGWADVGFSAAENMVKEVKEETGLDVSVKNLLAVFDKKMHPHPPQAFYVYKMVFHCTPISNLISKGFDVLDVQYFPLHQLPPLSENRILKSQIELLYQKIKRGEERAYFD